MTEELKQVEELTYSMVDELKLLYKEYQDMISLRDDIKATIDEHRAAHQTGYNSSRPTGRTNYVYLASQTSSLVSINSNIAGIVKDISGIKFKINEQIIKVRSMEDDSGNDTAAAIQGLIRQMKIGEVDESVLDNKTDSTLNNVEIVYEDEEDQSGIELINNHDDNSEDEFYAAKVALTDMTYGGADLNVVKRQNADKYIRPVVEGLPYYFEVTDNAATALVSADDAMEFQNVDKDTSKVYEYMNKNKDRIHDLTGM